MRCKVCGNDKDFVIEGKEVRSVDTTYPQRLLNYFVPTKAVCASQSCPSFPCTDVELDPLHPNLVPFKDVLGV